MSAPVGTCTHPADRRGKLDIRQDSGWSACTGRNSYGDHLGAVELEFCDDCGAVLVASQQVGSPKRKGD
jgi:hypothetical protein